MNKTRRNILASILMLIAPGMTGCALNSRNSSGSQFSIFEYEELVSSVLITKDGSKLIIMTDVYHYVFDAPEIIVKSLTGSFNKRLVAEFDDFRLNGKNEIYGSVIIRVIDASKSEVSTAVNAGFNKTPFGAETKVALSGIRYDANGVHPSTQHKLNREYRVKVKVIEADSNWAADNKPSATPVSKALDGALMIFALPLIAPVILYMCASEKGCQ